MPWKKGQSGNPNGRPNHERVSFIAMLKRRGMILKAVNVLARGLKANDIDCAKYVIDQMIGKAHQGVSTEITGKDGDPVEIKYNRAELLNALRELAEGKKAVIKNG